MSSMIESPTAVTGPGTGAVPGAPLDATTVVEVVVAGGSGVVVDPAGREAELVEAELVGVTPTPLPGGPVVGGPGDAAGVTAEVS